MSRTGPQASGTVLNAIGKVISITVLTVSPAGAHPGRFDKRGAAPFAGVGYDPQGHHPPPPEPDPSDEGEGEAGAGRSAAVRARFTQTGAIARRYSADA